MKSKISSLVNTSLIYGLGSIFNKSLDFLLLPLFTSYLSPKSYGIISTLAIFNLIFNSIFSLGFGTSIGVSYFHEQENQERKNKVIYSSLITLFLSSLVMFILGGVFVSDLSKLFFQSTGYESFILVSLLTTSMLNLSIPVTLFFQFENKAKLFVILTNISSFITILISILFVVFLKQDAKGMVLGTFISKAIYFFIFLFFCLKNSKIKLDFKIVKELLDEGIPTIPNFMSLFILYQSNRYILQLFSGLENVGIYSVGYNIGFAMSLFVNAFSSAWTPYFLSFGNKLEEAKELFGKILIYYLYAFGSLSLMFFIFAKPIIMLMTKESYHEAYQVVGLASTGQFLNGVFIILLPPFYFIKEVKKTGLSQISAAIFSVLINIILINYMGLLGAALALAFGVLLMAVFIYYWTIRNKDRYLQIKYPFKDILFFSIVYLIFASITLINRNFSLVTEIINSILQSLLLVITLYFLVPKEEKIELKNYIKTILNKKL